MEYDELQEELETLKKENAKLNKRIDRIVSQGDRQHKEIEHLNENLQSYIDVIDDNVITVTLTTQKEIKSVSTAFSNVFGFKIDEVSQKRYDYLLDKEYGQKFLIDIDDTVSQKLPWHGELIHMTKADAQLWTQTIVTPVFDVNGDLFEFTVISKDITDQKKLNALKAQKTSEKDYAQSMLEFMSSKSSALLQKASKKFSYTLWLLFAAVAWFLLWANFTKIDELARGKGKVLPKLQLQKLQSVDKGRVSKVFVREGSLVKKGQILFKLNDIASINSFEQNNARLMELEAKKLRLFAEANKKEIHIPANLTQEQRPFYNQEQSLYQSNTQQHQSNIHAIDEKLIQQKSQLQEAKVKFRALYENYNLLNEEIEIKQALLKDQIISKVEFLQLTRQKNEMMLEVNAMEGEIVKIESIIKETKDNKEIIRLDFINKAKKELNLVAAEVDRLKKSNITYSDQLKRTTIFAPVDGTINKIHVTTIGEVVPAGKVLAELVPSDGVLIAEVKIKPSDIAFIRQGQKAIVKVTAYDFAIHGGLDATISYISADTIVSETDGKPYYTVQLQTDKKYLGDEKNGLYIKVGMVVDADILLGKKSVMDYILKPIMKAKQGALSER